MGKLKELYKQALEDKKIVTGPSSSVNRVNGINAKSNELGI
jgi:hypothetical protein